MCYSRGAVAERDRASLGDEAKMSEELKRLIEQARTRPLMTAVEREEQLRNFAAGNVGLEDKRVTREVVDRAEEARLRRRAAR
jgi:hypothetical protein